MEPFQIPEGKPQKKGEVYTFSNGATYTGAIRNGKMHGAGQFVDPTGGRYDGEWRDGIMHGKGTCISSDGEKYVGEYHEGVPHGKGTYTFKNGNEYIGEYLEGKIHGNGVIRFPDNRRFVGEFRDNKKHGRGRYEGATGVYEGEYRDGKKEGHGTFTWIDGSSYEGPWMRDYMHGDNGLKRERDGSRFRVNHDMGRLLSATPLDSPDGGYAPPASIGGAGNPLSNFSDVSLAPSIAGGMTTPPGQPNLQRPAQPTLHAYSTSNGAAAAAKSSESAFHRTLSKPGANGDHDGGGVGEEDATPAPIAWVKEQWTRISDTVGCGGARSTGSGRQPTLTERARDACGGGCGFPSNA